MNRDIDVRRQRKHLSWFTLNERFLISSIRPSLCGAQCDLTHRSLACAMSNRTTKWLAGPVCVSRMYSTFVIILLSLAPPHSRHSRRWRPRSQRSLRCTIVLVQPHATSTSIMRQTGCHTSCASCMSLRAQWTSYYKIVHCRSLLLNGHAVRKGW